MQFDPDAPWWANTLLLLAVALIPVYIARRGAKRTQKTLDKVAANVATTAEQTANSHADAQYPNLRDELTAVRVLAEATQRTVGLLAEAQQAVREDVGGLHSEVRDARRDIAGVRTDARRDRRALDVQRQALEDHIADVPNVVTDAVRKAEADHIAACPARKTTHLTD